jgi:diguanylate cyclase (GGDEF)-like protein
MSSPKNAPETDREPFLEAALDSYLASILDIADTVASLGTDVAAACQDRLKRLHHRLSYDKSVKTLEESRSALHAELLDFQSKLREERMLAYLDPLTGVANRREFNRHLASRIADGRPFCVLLFDLNTFSTVNYDHGHLCGDEILRQLGNRLSTHVRPRDFVCRWGGDEFVAILECSLANAQARSEEIAQLLCQPYKVTVEGKEIEVAIGVSVGVVERMTEETAEQVLHRADEAMYRQKASRT